MANEEAKLLKLNTLTRDSVDTDALAIVVQQGEGSAGDASTIREAIGMGSADSITLAGLTVTENLTLDGTNPAINFAGSSGGTIGVVGQNNGDDADVTIPAAYGYVPVVPGFANDAAAGSGGLTTGQFYWDTTNAVLATKS